MKIYSIVGTNLEVIDQSSNPSSPSGHIEMSERRPTEKHIANADGTWRPNYEYVCELIHIERDRRWAGGFPVVHDDGQGSGEKTWWFHSDPKSVNHQNSWMDLAVIPSDRNWKTMDGTFVKVSEELRDKIRAIRNDYNDQIFQAGELHQIAMREREDPTDYDYLTGWPLCYEEWAAQQGEVEDT